MSNELHIPKDLLEDFRGGLSNEEISEDDTGNDTAVRSLEKSLDWIINAFDTAAKENDLPGIGKMKSEELASLYMVVIERNLSKEFMQRSPEIMAGAITSSIVAQNIIAQKRKQQNQQPEKEEKEENEQQ